MINFDSELLLGYNVFKESGLCNRKKLRNKRNNDLFAQYVRACNSCTS